MFDDFTLLKYKKICETLLDKEYKILTFEDYFNNHKDLNKKYVILRHDVDRFAKNSYNVAKLENSLGIKSSFYFRNRVSSFNKKYMDLIKNFDHEIGYHYEDLARNKGDYDVAYKSYIENLDKFKLAGFNVFSISMHGSPNKRHNSQDLWQQHDYKVHKILGDTNIDVNYKDLYYFTDAGRGWANENNLRDKVKDSLVHKVVSTNDLISFLKENNKSLIIQTHPERWSSNVYQHLRSFTFDRTTNLLKQLFKKMYFENSSI